MPYACSQVDWPGWLLEFHGAIFIVRPEEEFLFDFSGLLRPGPRKDLLSPWDLSLSLSSADLIALGDSAEVFSVMLHDEDLPLCLLLQCLR